MINYAGSVQFEAANMGSIVKLTSTSKTDRGTALQGARQCTGDQVDKVAGSATLSATFFESWIAKIDQILQNPPSTNLGRQCHILAHSLELLW